MTIVTVYFLLKEIENRSNSISLNRNHELELKKKTELIGILQNDIAIVGTNDIKIEEAFIPSDNILNFINALDRLVQEKSTTQVYRFENPIQSTVPAPFLVSYIPYSNNLTTDIKGFSNYLKEFEKLPYFTNIEELSISSQDKSGWIANSTIIFNAKLYTRMIQ
jgi:hypothetical protein